jgi:hypothetical protein
MSGTEVPYSLFGASDGQVTTATSLGMSLTFKRALRGSRSETGLSGPEFTLTNTRIQLFPTSDDKSGPILSCLPTPVHGRVQFPPASAGCSRLRDTKRFARYTSAAPIL